NDAPSRNVFFLHTRQGATPGDPFIVRIPRKDGGLDWSVRNNVNSLTSGQARRCFSEVDMLNDVRRMSYLNVATLEGYELRRLIFAHPYEPTKQRSFASKLAGRSILVEGRS